MIIDKAFKFKLYPNKHQAQMMSRHAGACRWLWNHFLALQMQKYEAEKKFIFRMEMQAMLPYLKKEHDWLGEAPAGSLQRVCKNLDDALKGKFKLNKGFPSFKKRGVSRESFYVSNQSIRLVRGGVVLPKLGKVKFRGGRLPEGKIMSATVSSDGDNWWISIQCQIDINPPVPTDTQIKALDLGLKNPTTDSDGNKTKPKKRLRKKERRLARAQRKLSKRDKGSANRKKQQKVVRKLHRKVRNQREDDTHKFTSSLVKSSLVVITEDLHIKGLMRNRSVAKSFADEGHGEALRQISYKCLWAGKLHHKVGRFYASTQICSFCETRKTGSDKLRLEQRIYKCNSCGQELDRDFNAALNIRREGLRELYDIYVGQAMPERTDDPSTPVEIPLPGQWIYSLLGTGHGNRNPYPSTSEIE